MLLGLGLEPDRGAVRQQFVEGGRVGDDAARRGDDHVAVDLHGLLQRAALVAAVGVGAVQVVDGAHAAAGNALDFLVEFEEGHAQLLGQHAAQCGLARAAQADQCDARVALAVAGRRAQQLACGQAHAAQVLFIAAFQQFADQQPFGAGGGHVAQQLGHGALQGLCNMVQDQHRHIARAVFEVGQVALRDIGRRRQGAPRHAPARAQAAHTLAQRLQHLVPGGF